MNLAMHLPPVQPRSRLAHEAVKWAGTRGRFDEYHIGLFRALFQFGQDIGDRRVLEQLAADLNLDPDDLSSALENGLFTQEVMLDRQEAGRIGIRAVPSYVMQGKVLASGVQSAAGLHKLISLPPD